MKRNKQANLPALKAEMRNQSILRIVCQKFNQNPVGRNSKIEGFTHYTEGVLYQVGSGIRMEM